MAIINSILMFLAILWVKIAVKLTFLFSFAANQQYFFVFIYITRQNFGQVIVSEQFRQALTALQFVCLRCALKLWTNYILGAALKTLAAVNVTC